MPKNDEKLNADGQGHVLVRMAYQSPQDSHWETLEIAVPPTASDEYIENAFIVYGKVRKIMAKTIVDLLTADDNPRIEPEAQAQPERAPYQTRTNQPQGGYKSSKPAPVVYVDGNPYATVLNFGKYAGKTLGWIEAGDESYIEWLYDKGREDRLRSDCNVIISSRGTDAYDTAMLEYVAIPPRAPEPTQEDGTAEDWENLVDDDLFPAN